MVAQIDCSKGWYSLKQNPSFLEGRSINSHVFSNIVPTQCPACNLIVLFIPDYYSIVLEMIYNENQTFFQKKTTEEPLWVLGPKTLIRFHTFCLWLLYNTSSPGLSTHHNLVHDFNVPRI